MPVRGGDAHHPRRPVAAVLSLNAFIGMPPGAVMSQAFGTGRRSILAHQGVREFCRS
jgi:hypothetical protein